MNEIDQYIADADPSFQPYLKHFREVIISTVPSAVEQMSYGMPGYKYLGKPLIYFGAFKDHMSIFPTNIPIEMMHEELQMFNIKKGTIQVTTDRMILDDTLKKLIHTRKSNIESKE